MKIGILIIILSSLVSGCASNRTGSICTALPLKPSADFEYRWTVSEKKQAIVLNESGEIICGRYK